jgi:UDP-N-acetylmuramoyl-tripeptide--D-alanyl-D-alanine ligase
MNLTIEEILKAVTGQLLQGALEHRAQGVSTDSRTLKTGELFIALKGEHFDGHDFITETVVGKASGLIVGRSCNVQKLVSLRKDIPVIQVSDTLTALGDLARTWTKKNRATIVAITGSNGKTTTREMTATIVARSHHVLKPEHNWNNLIGLPLTLLRLRPDHEVAVVEMGMNRKGEIKRLAQIAQPHIGVITNISAAHLEHLRTLQEVAQAKGELFDTLTAESHAVVNIDDPLIVERAQRCPAGKITFGISAQAQVTALNIPPVAHNETHFTLQIGDKRIPIMLRTPGTHSIYNALAAAATATLLHMSPEEIQAGLNQFRPFPGRMETIRIPDTITIINDTYNANPTSMHIALKTLAQLSGPGRRIAVLGDMAELGDASQDFHHQVGSLIKKMDLSAAVLMGPHAHIVKESARAHGMREEALYIAENHEEIAQYLDEHVQANDWILFKGSRTMQMEKSLEQFLRLRSTAAKVIPFTKPAPLG